MNPAWLILVLRIIAAVPGAILGVQAITNEAHSGATKRQMAIDSLGIANMVATTALPQHQDTINAATGVAGNLIDTMVAAAKDPTGNQIATQVVSANGQPAQTTQAVPSQPQPSTPLPGSTQGTK